MERLILCGAGHISQQIARMAQYLDFELAVIDDRSEFANTERFPMPCQLLCMPFLAALERLGSESSDYYVIVTRGHTFDQDCLEYILRGRYAYVGMIGSRGKVAATMDALKKAGFSQKELNGVHAPIGLAIGAQTPAEIAVSILAQLVQVRSELGPGQIQPPAVPGVLCTIVKKSGSAPRGEGTWMLVRTDGQCIGSIGGGSVEHQVIADALAMQAAGKGEQRLTYDLSRDAEDLGMVCGGRIEVLFTARGQQP